MMPLMKNRIFRLPAGIPFMVFVFAFFCSGRVYSQGITPQNMEKLQIMEDSLLRSTDSMFEAYIPDSRVMYSERFAAQLVRTLKIPASYYYPFDSLKKFINIIYSDDNAFKIFNWEITPGNVSKRYYGAIQMPGEKLRLFGLIDYAEELGKGAEDSILKNRKWYGALYYRIIPHEVGGTTVYTLFGMNASSPFSTKKVLDAMTITENGVVFGAPIFGVASENFPRRRINRFILEYKKGVQVSMNWDQEKNMIYFDKLVSQINDPHRKYTYVPSGQYDGFSWENETWTYHRDLIPVQILKDGDAPSEQPK
jgi:hypothetical protein